MARQTVNLLPSYYQTDKNSKFLSSTLDQLIQKPSLDRLNSYIGSQLTPTYKPVGDVYLTDAEPLRNNYQLLPGLVIKDDQGDVSKVLAYNDLVNQLNFLGGNVDNLDRLFRPDFYSYDPRIDWDKFVNYHQYYWMPTGPNPVLITGTQKEITSTYSIKSTKDDNFFIFTPDGLTTDPVLTLYRGVTYIFNVDSDFPIYIKTARAPGADSLYNVGITNNGIKKGQIIFTVTNTTPIELFYNSDEGKLAGGQFVIKSRTDNSYIDVASEILGKVNYTSSQGIEFVNGLVVVFGGDVTPSGYANGKFIVEGVGSAITLTDFSKLKTPEKVATPYQDGFDDESFDDFPFDENQNVPLTPEYVTINKSSLDLNPWTRYNRWFHVDVLKASAKANGTIFELPSTGVAKRPIIEFNTNIKLFNFGTTGITPVDHIDNTTTDVFKTVENSPGFYIDDVALEPGDRVIFNADKDSLVTGRIFIVNFVNINLTPNDKFSVNRPCISLVPAEDSMPLVDSVVIINKGKTQQGSSWWYTNVNGIDKWVEAQDHTVLNQSPLFDVIDSDGNSFGSSYYNSNFKGTKIFGYQVGKGTPDPILGFPLNYQSEALESTYLFENYFMTDTFVNIVNNVSGIFSVSSGYLQLTTPSGTEYINVWTQASEYPLAVQQFQVLYDQTSSIQITVFDNPAYIKDLSATVFVNHIKIPSDQYSITTSTLGTAYINFNQVLSTSTNGNTVLLNLYSSESPNSTGAYEAPINLTNNPLNGPIGQFTLSEIIDHVKDMTYRDPQYQGTFPGSSNLSNLPDPSKYGARFISNKNSLSFAQYFIGNQEHNLVNAISASGKDYNQFKLNFINYTANVPSSYSPAEGVDYILSQLNENKNVTFPYFLSDMVPFGTNKITKKYNVLDSRITIYPISGAFDITKISNRSVLVYLNGDQLVYGSDYTFDQYDPAVSIIKPIQAGDVLVINDYTDTDGCYIPPTPTKLGLYPSFKPSIYVDNTYADGPKAVIQGHDGSIIIAFNDYRDQIILEYETRVYNNLKTQYDADLFDINFIFPGRFRNNLYSYKEIYNFIQPLFVGWATQYNVDYTDNLKYDIANHKTYNYKSAIDYLFGGNFTGSWRSIYKYYFDTDRPDTHPWEMLGFSIKPDWWDSYYGPAPYTSGNLLLWTDLENGYIAQGTNKGFNLLYARPGLSKVIPVDDNGNIVDIRKWGSLISNDSIPQQDQPWAFGDWGPAENAWRRSSNWPFAVQIMMALSKPADYSNKLFDTSRMHLNKAGQYTYTAANRFISTTNVVLQGDTDGNGNIIRSAGYGVYVLEIGKKRRSDYVSYLKQQLSSGNFNLVYKVGGFVSQNQLKITVDAYNLATQDPTPFLPNENYTIFFNKSNPVLSIAISGVIVIKSGNSYTIRGYDTKDLYFNIFKPIHSINDTTFTVGGTSETYLPYSSGQAYKAGQVIYYQNNYYRVITNNVASTTFNASYYQLLSGLPTIGGTSVIQASKYETSVTSVPYNTVMSSVQAVFDFLVGYGKYLESRGFVFNEFNKNFNQMLNWNFSAQEFTYWSEQNWADNSVITLSPFANALQFQFQEGVVDNILDSFYDYSLYTANGSAVPINDISIARSSGNIYIKSLTTTGIYFARLNLVQKEHVLIFDNTTLFKDVIYDIESGYRQLRMKLQGFRTSNWSGDFFSPGFVYDNLKIQQWKPYQSYLPADVVQYVGNYYSANSKITGTSTFDFTQWFRLPKKPTAQLLPNFDYQINQFQDFYSLDIDNFDTSEQSMSQHLTGYSPRPYLDNIFTDPTSQYKFYQGYIKEKGTLNSITKLEKAAAANMLGTLDIYEEWAFRAGSYGSYSSYNELEFNLREHDFIENAQTIQFIPAVSDKINDVISYILPTDLSIRPNNYVSTQTFATVTGTNSFVLPYAGYARLDDVQYTFTSTNALLSISDNSIYNEGDRFWIGFDNVPGGWNVYRYSRNAGYVNSATQAGTNITFNISRPHGLVIGQYVSITEFNSSLNGFYQVSSIPSNTQFTVISSNFVPNSFPARGLLFILDSIRFNNVDDLGNLQFATKINDGELFWIDDNANGKWAVYKKKNIYADNLISSYIPELNSQFGYKLAKRASSSTIVISAVNQFDITKGYGDIFVYDVDPNSGDFNYVYNYGCNDAFNQWRPTADRASFGDELFYDDTDDLIFASASNASTGTILSGISQTTGYYTSVNNSNLINKSGLVKISGIYREGIKGEITFGVLYNTDADRQYSRFGTGLYVQGTKTNKNVLIGAPGIENDAIHTGTVYQYALFVTESPTFINTSGSQLYYLSSGNSVFGVGASFNVSFSGPTYNVSIANTGTGYIASGVITIAGNTLGGYSPANDLSITVQSVNGAGNITSFTSSGNPNYGVTATFDVASQDRAYLVSIVNSGTNYTTGSYIVIPGNQLGGIAPDNNLDIQITGVNSYGSIVSVSNTTSVTSFKSFDIKRIGTISTKGTGVTRGSQFGYSITGSRDGNMLAISAPNKNSGIGSVFIYTNTNNVYTLYQTIDSTSTAVKLDYLNVLKQGDKLGSSIHMSENGNYLFVAAQYANDGITSPGKVGVYKWNGTTFNFVQLINNPATSNINFGQSISATPDAGKVVITGQGTPFFVSVSFDGGKTTFDSHSTKFGQTIPRSGSSYVYERYNESFIYSQQLIDTTIDVGGEYGYSAIIDNNNVYVGNPDISSGYYGSVHAWINTTSNSTFGPFREQTDLVDIELIDNSYTIDTLKDNLVDYLDVVDPIKGRLSGLAEQELTYQTLFDPAVYNQSIGLSSVVSDQNKFWEKDHVGELWWDLSTIKYVWYEQGESLYRKNAWGKIFPGCTVDVYEWVETTYLPTQWASLSGTNAGLTLGVSGIPKFADNSVYSSIQTYDSSTGQFNTLYYYWVKNTVVVPANVGRRISAYEVASIIQDPIAYGLKYISVISPDSLAITNYDSSLIGNRINLNLAYNNIKTNINKHTEWTLIQENNANSLPPAPLVQKLVDSLLGHDKLGNPVPDPTLSPRQSYGIQIRPRQSMFVDRIEALRNLMGFVNDTLSTMRISGFINFHNLNSKEEIPDIISGQYDQLVEDKLHLDLIETKNLVTGLLACSVKDGKIVSVEVLDPGYGYLKAPTILVGDGTSGAKLQAIIDGFGKIIYVNIINPGSKFIDPPVLVVRPYTVILQIDPEYNNKWSKFQWTGSDWLREHTQLYDTTQYWKYIDWIDPSFNRSKLISNTVEYVYQVQELDLNQLLNPGDYVKVQNAGNGNYIILRKTPIGTLGSFDADFDIIYSQNGTIQILDAVWNTKTGDYGFDQITPFDESLFDQTSDTELKNILLAIQEDIFSGDNRIYWNKFFFAAVKYVLTEQRFVDWVFKTSFINVTNQAGVLDQRVTYRFQDPTWYEDYIKEVKPYHTQIRNYQVNYEIGESNDTPWEPTASYTTDFDLPSYFNTSLNTFTSVTTSSGLFSQYPYKEWYDNHTYFVDHILLENPGQGYTSVPVVSIIPAYDDLTAATATAVAYIASGSISHIEVINGGNGYTKQPTVLITGGGSTSLTTATAYAQLSNNKVRNNFIHMKFDRITTNREIGEIYATTTATTNGIDHIFDLGWYSTTDKTDIVATLNGQLVLKSNYTITNYTSIFNIDSAAYKKQYSQFVLNYIPPANQLLSVTYKKNIELYSAAERIQDYYNTAPGKLGNTSTQLMYGAEYPGINVTALEFGAEAGFGDLGFGSDQWGDAPLDVFYTQVTTAVDQQEFTTPIVSTGTSLNVYVESWGPVSTVTNTYTNVLLSSMRIDNNGTYFNASTLIGAGNPITVIVKSAAFSSTSSFSRIVFRTPEQNTSLLSTDVDTVLDGGDLAYTTALGYRPSDIIVDGDKFVSPYTSYAPEEMIPGQIQESLGIDVFTIVPQGSPSVIDQSYYITDINNSTTISLDLTPPSTGSVIVSYNGSYLLYGLDYELDFINNTITVNTQTSTGVLSITVVGVGGVNLLSTVAITTNTNTAQISSRNLYRDVGSLYITVNGITAVKDTTSGLGYTFTATNSNIGVANIYGMNTGTNNIQGWFLTPRYKAFNELKQQLMVIPDIVVEVDNDVSGNTPSIGSTYVLSQNTNTLQIHAGWIMADANGAEYIVSSAGPLFQGWGISFYQQIEIVWPLTFRSPESVPTSQFNLTQNPGIAGPFEEQMIVEVNGLRLDPPDTTYYQVVNNQTSFLINPFLDSPMGVYSLDQIKVFVNGRQLNNSRDFQLEQNINTILFKSGFLNNGDALAIVTYRNAKYTVDENKGILKLATPLQPGGMVNVITFNSADALGIHTERFSYSQTNDYPMVRPISNSNYVWVSVSGKPLVSNYDYIVSPDGYTVKISTSYQYSSSDTVLITSINDKLATDAIGYKQFTDILGRTQYKRFSNQNTTVLTQDLWSTSTNIHVADPGVLSLPSTATNQAGVIFVNLERIEFFTITGNVLGQIKRATLGTGAKEHNSIGTPVVDAGILETIPDNGKTLIQKVITTNTTTYTISTVSNDVIGSGIILNPNITGSDQIQVYYAGTLLLKTTSTYHNNRLGYDSEDNDSDYIIPPQFTVDIASSTITLNLQPQSNPQHNVKFVPGSILTIVQKIDKTWYKIGDNVSLLDSITPQAQFLLAGQSGLPDKYQYEST